MNYKFCMYSVEHTIIHAMLYVHSERYLLFESEEN